MKHGYLIDMDGVLYRGSQLIRGADEFLRQLRVRDIPFRLLTNNSQRTRRDVVAKVARMGIEIDGALPGPAEAQRHRLRHRRGRPVDGIARERLRGGRARA
jgi:Haloacid dehalogenase-like hydrolase